MKHVTSLRVCRLYYRLVSNYGAAGGIIGHELTHGFDDQGRKIDAAGALRDWWTEKDAQSFNKRAAALGAQFSQYHPLPGVTVNGELTMGENIADLGNFDTGAGRVSCLIERCEGSAVGRPHRGAARVSGLGAGVARDGVRGLRAQASRGRSPFAEAI